MASPVLLSRTPRLVLHRGGATAKAQSVQATAQFVQARPSPCEVLFAGRFRREAAQPRGGVWRPTPRPARAAIILDTVWGAAGALDSGRVVGGGGLGGPGRRARTGARPESQVGKRPESQDGVKEGGCGGGSKREGASGSGSDREETRRAAGSEKRERESERERASERASERERERERHRETERERERVRGGVCSAKRARASERQQCESKRM